MSAQLGDRVLALRSASTWQEAIFIAAVPEAVEEVGRPRRRQDLAIVKFDGSDDPQRTLWKPLEGSQ